MLKNNIKLNLKKCSLSLYLVGILLALTACQSTRLSGLSQTPSLNSRSAATQTVSPRLNSLPTVTVYGINSCLECWRTRLYLHVHHIPYTFYNVETSERGRAVYYQLGGPGVPIIYIGNKRIIGYDTVSINRALKLGN